MPTNTNPPVRDPSEMGMPARHHRLTEAASDALKLLEDMEENAALRLPYPNYDDVKKALEAACDPRELRKPERPTLSAEDHKLVVSALEVASAHFANEADSPQGFSATTRVDMRVTSGKMAQLREKLSNAEPLKT